MCTLGHSRSKVLAERNAVAKTEYPLSAGPFTLQLDARGGVELRTLACARVLDPFCLLQSGRALGNISYTVDYLSFS